jgi:uncharacterized protein YdeI (YjbR/CyaY-like superfamily)
VIKLSVRRSEEDPVLSFKTQRAWESWLAKNHAESTGVWIRFAKKSSGIRSVSYAEAVEAALCYGWIDGQAKKDSSETYLQRFTRRAKRSIWSKINRDKALKLIDAGRMQPSGLAEIDRAKADGRWDAAYDSWSQAGVPEDLRAALNANPAADTFFQSLDSRNTYAILFRIQTARKAETRASKIRQYVEMLSKREKLYL